MSDQMTFSLQLEQAEGFEFKVKFDWPGVAELLLDEPEPLGKKHGCLRTKFKQNPGPVRANVTARLERNERGRFRIAGLDVKIDLAEDAAALGHFERCMEQFEDFCIVTESVRQGIPVAVRVVDKSGRTVHESGAEQAAQA